MIGTLVFVGFLALAEVAVVLLAYFMGRYAGWVEGVSERMGTHSKPDLATLGRKI